jgi:hypothetical protein
MYNVAITTGPAPPSGKNGPHVKPLLPPVEPFVAPRLVVVPPELEEAPLAAAGSPS